MMTSMSQQKMWQELLPGLADANGNRDVVNGLLTEQYDVIYGSWPTAKEEIVLIVDENNELDDLTLYALGLLDRTEIDAIIDAAANGRPLEKTDSQRWTYEELCQKTFKTIMPYDFYTDFNNDGIYEDMSENPLMLRATTTTHLNCASLVSSVPPKALTPPCSPVRSDTPIISPSISSTARKIPTL